ncbi:Do family serine endopeptidase [Stakelama saccharophila]|uniref:Probable periplasmic serine endoprotease DegP-like n=1 Tax=Stakelama saccharophila TaxID=3075605 RepID=A0ABZ0BA40_9SPHN|nr:Do family serine endopeptidase [Stakelama sp. W311]WNO54150.1 Do family serine endopeptidase [Stakelama sp. W311]
MRYAYAITTALLLGGTAATMTLQPPAGAQTAQNDRDVLASAAPRPGAPASFADMVEKLQPAVVNISTTQKVKVNANPFAGTPFSQFFGNPGGDSVTREAESLGSGFIISPDGYVVTNNHVIAAGNANAVVQSIMVTLTDGKEYKAKLIGNDAASDLAVLKIEGDNLPFVKFGNSDSARVGDWVVAIGQPYGLGGTVTAGIISALHRVTGQGAYDRFIQTDAAINRGNSGGPMFDMDGNVIGINSQILSPSGGNVGIGFAIPATEAKPIIDTLMKGEAVERGYLGVGPQPITDDLASALDIPEGNGELIRSVQPGEAADKAGIRQGDVVLSVNGKDVTPDQTLSYLVANIKPGTTVPLTVLRDGKRMKLNVTLGKRPPESELQGFNPEDEAAPQSEDTANPAKSIGLRVAPLTAQIARSIGVDPDTNGLVVLGTDPSSDAAAKGIGRGAVIVSANRQPVSTPEELGQVVAKAKAAGREQVLLYVIMRGIGRYVAVSINDGE